MRADLILFGPPGAGKGTQGEILADARSLLRLSTGDVLRDAVRRGTAMGAEARRYMDAGELAPDDVILGIVRDYLAGEAANRGVIFDGFPRTLAQAEGLDRLLTELGRSVRAVLVLMVEDDVLVKRLSGRRTCSLCGRVYNVYFDPPAVEAQCDACGGDLTLRPDDDPATVRRRLQVYQDQTAPLLTYYGESATPLHRVDGDRPVEVVSKDLIELIDS